MNLQTRAAASGSIGTPTDQATAVRRRSERHRERSREHDRRARGHDACENGLLADVEHPARDRGVAQRAARPVGRALRALPASQGGYIETVRDIVTSTIVNELAAGQSTTGDPQASSPRPTTRWPQGSTTSPTSSMPKPTATRWARARAPADVGRDEGVEIAESTLFGLRACDTALRRRPAGSASSAAPCSGFGATEISPAVGFVTAAERLLTITGCGLRGPAPHGRVRERLAGHRDRRTRIRRLKAIVVAGGDSGRRHRRGAASRRIEARPTDRHDRVHLRGQACDHEDRADERPAGGRHVRPRHRQRPFADRSDDDRQVRHHGGLRVRVGRDRHVAQGHVAPREPARRT